MRKDSGKPGYDQLVRDIDGILPEDINRRRFVKAAVAPLAGSLLAGCSGGGSGDGSDGSGDGSDGSGDGSDGSGDGSDGDSGTDEGRQMLTKDGVVFRTGYRALPAYATPQVASQRGLWEEASISAPEVRAGIESTDTVKRVGSGREQIGSPDVQSAMAGIIEGQELTLVGHMKQRFHSGLVWRTDRLDGPQDLEGKTVAYTPTEGAQSFPLYADLINIDPSSVEIKEGGEADIVAGYLADGSADAAFFPLFFFFQWEARMPDDVQLDADPLHPHMKIPGHSVFVNSTWYNDTSDNVEYMSRILEAYSYSVKWQLLNPEEFVTLLTEEINPQIAGIPTEILLDLHRFSVPERITEHALDNGLASVDMGAMENMFNKASPYLLENYLDLPSVDEVVDTEPSDNADLATLSNDELNQAIEFAGRAAEIYGMN